MRSLILKDLLRRWRSPIPTLVSLAFPFLMTLIISAFAGGEGDGGGGFPQIRLLLLDRDDSVLSRFLVGASGNEEMADKIQVVSVGEEGFSLMQEGDASAMVVLPEGFQDAVLKGKPCELLVVRNPAEAIKPEIVEQGVEVLATYADQAGHLLGPSLDDLATLMEMDHWPTRAAVTALSERFFDQFQEMDRYVFPPVVQIRTTTTEGEEQGLGDTFNLMGYLLMMISVMSVLFVCSQSINDLFEEEQSGMLRRQLATPAGLGRLVSAKLVFSVVLSMLVMVLLMLFGAVLGWFSWPVDLAALLLHTFCLSLAASGLLTVIFSLTRTQRQAGLLSWLVIMAMSALGGSFFPSQFMPEGLKTVSHFTLNYWAIQGYLELLVEHEPLRQMMHYSLVLLAVGVGTMLVGRILLVRRFQEVR